jgi:hypothetical protein
MTPRPDLRLDAGRPAVLINASMTGLEACARK